MKWELCPASSEIFLKLSLMLKVTAISNFPHSPKRKCLVLLTLTLSTVIIIIVMNNTSE